MEICFHSLLCGNQDLLELLKLRKNSNNKLSIPSADKDSEQLKYVDIAGDTVTLKIVFHEMMHTCIIRPSNSTSTQEKLKNVHTKISIGMFIGTLFTIVKNWKQYKYSSAGAWINKMCVAIQWNTYPPIIKGTNTCYNMDES